MYSVQSFNESLKDIVPKDVQEVIDDVLKKEGGYDCLLQEFKKMMNGVLMAPIVHMYRLGGWDVSITTGRIWILLPKVYHDAQS